MKSWLRPCGLLDHAFLTVSVSDGRNNASIVPNRVRPVMLCHNPTKGENAPIDSLHIEAITEVTDQKKSLPFC